MGKLMRLKNLQKVKKSVCVPVITEESFYTETITLLKLRYMAACNVCIAPWRHPPPFSPNPLPFLTNPSPSPDQYTSTTVHVLTYILKFSVSTCFKLSIQ